jgi:hypothetical protein
LEKYGIWDPRIEIGSQGVGPGLVYTDNVNFSLIFPLYEDASSVNIYDGETDELLVTVDLTDVSPSPGIGITWVCPGTSDIFLTPTPNHNRPYLASSVNLPTGTEPSELLGVYHLEETTGEWEYFIPAFTMNTLDSLDPNEAYYMAVSGACSWQLQCEEGSIVSTGDLWVYPGTSDIFLAPTPTHNRPYLADSVNLPTGTEPPQLLGVYHLDETTGEWEYFIPAFTMNTLDSLDPGEAYYMAISGACSWPLD